MATTSLTQIAVQIADPRQAQIVPYPSKPPSKKHHIFHWSSERWVLKRRRSNVAVIIVGILFISAFLFDCILWNHSFQTNPNSITNYYVFSNAISSIAFLFKNPDTPALPPNSIVNRFVLLLSITVSSALSLPRRNFINNIIATKNEAPGTEKGGPNRARVSKAMKPAEVHFIGELTGCSGFGDGVSCRWTLDYGESWKLTFF